VRIRAVDSRSAPGESDPLLAMRAVYPQLAIDRAAANPQNSWPCTIADATFSGDFIEYAVTSPWGTVVVHRPPTDRFAISAPVTLSIDPKHCVVIAR
jgi:hypothetical protein